MLVIAAVCSFSAYKVIGWDPAKTTCSKPTTEILKCEICSELTINTVESCSGVFIVNFEHI